MGVCAIRIDERLIHGQVATLWQGAWNCNRMMVIDSKSANDPILKSVLKIACPTGVKLSVLEAEKAAANLVSGKYGRERITIVTKTPQCLCDLIRGGYELEADITVGNMSTKPGATQIRKTVFVSPEEKAAFAELVEMGIPIYSQMVPNEAREDISELLRN